MAEPDVLEAGTGDDVRKDVQDISQNSEVPQQRNSHEHERKTDGKLLLNLIAPQDSRLYGDVSHVCERCKAVGLHGTETSCKHLYQRDSDNVRTEGSGCSSPASVTGSDRHDPRLPESRQAWSPSASQVHFIADSPLTPTRFRLKSEAETITNPVHAHGEVGLSVRRVSIPSSLSTGSERVPSSSTSSSVESPRGEPAGSASGSLSLHGSSTSSSASQTPSSTHSRTPSVSPSAVSTGSIPPVDPSALLDIERQCKRVADNVDLMLGHLSSTLQNMSAITVGHTQTYRDAVEKAGITVDQNVKCMYALIAKCEELNKAMKPVHDLANLIKSIKSLLEEMEAAWK